MEQTPEKEEINFKKEHFDKILMIDVLEHLENPQRVIQCASNWLKKDGYLFISTPRKNQHRIFFHSYRDTFSYGNDKHFFEGFDIPTLINWLKKSGFTGEIKAEYVFYKLYQFGWELSETIKQHNKIIYVIFLPLFEILAFLDRFFHFGKQDKFSFYLALFRILYPQR